MIRLYTFLIFVAIIVVLGLVFFALPRQDYMSQTHFLIVPQDAVIASNADNIVNDIVLISNSAVKNNQEVVRYNAQVHVDRIEGHDAMKMTILSHKSTDIVFLEKSVIKGIVKDIGRFYEINSDFSLKIIEKDRVPYKTFLAVFSPYILMITIIIGVIAGILALFYLVDRVREERDYDEAINGEKIFEKYNTQPQRGIEDTEISENEIIEEEIIIPQITEKEIVEEKVVQKEETPIEIAKKEEQVFEKNESVIPSSLPTTPGNLPVVDLDSIGFSKNDDTENNENLEELDREPTEEELKARLNALLNGKL